MIANAGLSRTVVVSVFAGFAALIAFAQPAAAQGAKVDFAAGYQYFVTDSEGGYYWPAGWGASFGIGKDWLKLVGEIGGHYGGDDGFHYRLGDNLHTFQAGIEVSRRGARVLPFARLLSGLAYFSGDQGNTSALIVTPEGGLKVMATDRFGVQATMGFPFLVDDDPVKVGVRFFVGVVIRK